MQVFDRFVALGDSFTEGLDDRRPDGTYRGWADLVAARLAHASPEFRYANLAIRGRRLIDVRDEQLLPALRMQPDLVTLAAGGNDLLRPKCDVAALGRTFREVTHSLTGSGSTVLVFAGFDPRKGLPLGRVIRARAAEYNAGVRATAGELGVLVVDLWRLEDLYQPHMWAPDRLHLSRHGHVVVAQEVIRKIGLHPAPAFARQDPPVAEPLPWRRARAADLAWSRTHLWPWIVRHSQGKSSGDDLDPKVPVLTAPPNADVDLG